MKQEIRDKYEVVIGLEVHAQLQTESKIFAADAASFGGSPNTHISPITLGHPGTLPKLNRKAVEYLSKWAWRVIRKLLKINTLTAKITSIPTFRKAIKSPKTKRQFVWAVAWM
jgi:aspartyl-tRNA(Asn)/glutamyl-tRNA(Gln) amidotransferase subunit B